MADHHRPDPDQLLKTARSEERSQKRARLTIFLGYAAGVGKTYAMLDSAHQRRVERVDVVVGYIETHGRTETEALLRDLEVIPRRVMQYRGVQLSEMDLDAVMARRPDLAVVDELAHTNAPGSRHVKRYQDVMELLEAGIDVYTTLNVQHLESLNEVVTQITGAVVRETVPDRIIDESADIRVVDLPTEELLRRLDEGKVYVPDQAARAIRRFFRKGNLTALREIALRRAAARVDDQMLDYMRARAIAGPWSAGERLLVCVSPSTLSERLVRSARRLADELNAEWIALHVETPSTLGPDDQSGIAGTLQIARELGAQVVTLPGRDVAETTLDYARRFNITKIIVGKPLHPRWREWLLGSVVDRLVRQSGPIDVYVISGEAESATQGPSARPRLGKPLRRYLQAGALVAGATVISLLIDPALSGLKWALFLQLLTTGQRHPDSFFQAPSLAPINLVMIYLAAVVVCALYLGRGPAILASALSVLTFDFFFTLPYLTFEVSDTQYVLTFVGLFTVGVVISTLAAQVRSQVESSQRRSSQTAALYGLSHDLASASTLNDILQAVVRHLRLTFARELVVLLPDDGRVHPAASTEGISLDENELAVAEWVFRNGEPAGRLTSTLPAARLRYLPLKASHGTVGVLGVKSPADALSNLSPEQLGLMEAFASQAALAIERARLSDAARRAALLEATEKLQTALLSAVSHDLRTPLVSITGALSSLQQHDRPLDEVSRDRLLEIARHEAERLNRLVGNLLDMTRLEAGALHVSKEPCDVQDLVGTALEQLGQATSGHRIIVAVPDDLPLVPMDFVLMIQVVVNLIDNAVKYSPSGAAIDVQANAEGDHLCLLVSDRGMGIPTEDLGRVFDKFFRVHRPEQVAGTGLGLSICKGIVEAHGGTIVAENRPGGGTVMSVELPLS
jgi:two-component system sensor histidine kinase KdpD